MWFIPALSHSPSPPQIDSWNYTSTIEDCFMFYADDGEDDDDGEPMEGVEITFFHLVMFLLHHYNCLVL